TLSWLARREFRRDRGVFRFGTATESLLVALALFGELYQWCKTRIDAVLVKSLRGVYPIRGAHVLGNFQIRTGPAQVAAGLHGQLQKQVIAHQVVDGHLVAGVELAIGLARIDVELFVIILPRSRRALARWRVQRGQIARNLDRQV